MYTKVWCLIPQLKLNLFKAGPHRHNLRLTTSRLTSYKEEKENVFLSLLWENEVELPESYKCWERIYGISLFFLLLEGIIDVEFVADLAKILLFQYIVFSKPSI